MSTDQGGKQAAEQQSAVPVPLRRYPVAWSGTGHTLDITGACELSDRRLLSSSGDGTLRLWSSEAEELRELTGHTRGVNGACELSDRRLLSWSRDDTLRLWSSEGEELRVLTGHTDLVDGACELSDRRLLSWSGDRSLRLWSSEGEPLNVLGLLPYRADPLMDVNADFSLLFAQEGKVIRGYAYSSEFALTWQTAYRQNTPQPDPKKAAAAIARTIKKYATDDTAVYLSLRSTWATEVLLELDRKVLPHIRGIQCTDAAVYEEITGVMPELELDLLQFTRLPGTETLNTLYGVQAQRVLMFCCNDLRRLEGSNCLIGTVEVVDCPHLDYVRVGGMVGEAEVVREPPEEQQ